MKNQFKLDRGHYVALWQIEVEEQYADVVGKLGVEAIQEAGQVLKMFCPLTGEYRVGNNWKETH